jgi:hypothetical protein
LRKLPVPDDAPSAVVAACLTRVLPSARKTSLESRSASIVVASDAYLAAALTCDLHTLVPRDYAPDDEAQGDMEWLYSNGMVRKGSGGRLFYDKLLSSPSNGICPLCALRQATTLDHHLPKFKYPLLTITPSNLVPCCRDCNAAKLSAVPTSKSSQLLHPYFDDVGGETWLAASVLQSDPPAIVYRVESPQGWDTVLSERLERHFDALRLGTLYGANAASELVSRRVRLKQIHAAGGAGELKLHLDAEFASAELADKNSWRSAMYAAVANEAWFCDVGFALVG